MALVSVIPTIEPDGGGFMLRVRTLDSVRVWRKWHESKENAIEDAGDIGLVEVETFGNAARRTLKPVASIAIERLEQFGLREAYP
ncbi:MAG TPA: hypothetical protein VGI45_35140 [Terracidiphilus sp.]